jgi:DNA (cytosine-5)-methyltransferase 1
MKSKLTCVDLFAGCGGLSLGLEQAGFRPLLFSEINHSAADTYMANREDQEIDRIGDVYSLTDKDISARMRSWRGKGIADVDLVCGGPPCQGYSGIGHRRTFKLDKNEIPSNQLYHEMIRVIRAVRPKIFLFENVRGLINSRWTKDGKKGEVFRDVLQSFRGISDYEVHWELVHAKDYGVPQNRPRVLVVGIRHDLIPKRKMVLKEDNVDYVDLPKPDAIERGFLPEPTGGAPSLTQLLADLANRSFEYGGVDARYMAAPKNNIQKQLRTKPDGSVLKKGAALTEQEYSNHKDHVVEKFEYMLANKGLIPEHLKTKKFAQRVMPAEWGAKGPTITATSLPDDFVHYALPRTPTVREWARIQTFPDWYKFCGPRTTGGRRRAGDPGQGLWDRDVPKYTQIGNAVPVWLAEAVGRHFAKLLKTPSKVIR